MTFQMLRMAGDALRVRRARRRRLQVLLWTVLIVQALGCDSDSSSGVTLSLIAPAADQVLTGTDDTDPDMTGLQFDVQGTSRGLDQGTSVKLFIDGDEQAVSGRIGDDGDITIPDVDLPPGTHTLYLQTSTASATSDEEQQYTLQALVIEAPDNDALLTAEDDEDGAEEGVQISVTVSAFAIGLGEDVRLLLDGEETDSKPADEDGEIVYSGITLSNGTHTFQAVTGDDDAAVESGVVSVQVQESCAAITFLTPAVPVDGQDSVSLGGAGDCPANGGAFTTTIRISTDAGSGRPVTLRVNDQLAQTTTVDGAIAEFEDVELNRRTSANELEIEVENSDGVICVQRFPVGVFVDCAGSDCTIASPTPVGFVDDEAELSLFLNAGLRGEEGFDIDVESGAELDGREVQLVIDGNSRRALTATAEASGASSTARFSGVNLAEGEHTIEGLCTDAAGNVTTTGEVTWIVDTTACSVAVTDPAEDTLFVPADDEDNASAGTQLVVSSTVTGGDCVRQRSAVCDIADGIEGAAFVAYDGLSPLLATITLEDEEDQALCVEIEDRAGNIGLGAVGVFYRATAPELEIESPSHGDRYNALGGGGYIADADPSGSPTACDAEFSVLCTELGVDVQLRHGSATGSVFASAECQEHQSGDPALPNGFTGRAKVTALFGDGDTSAVIVATQAFAAGSTSELVGASPPITIESDCRRPTPAFAGISCTPPNNQIELADADDRTFSVIDNTPNAVIDDISLTLARDGGASTMPTPSDTMTSAVTYTGIDLAFDGAGTVTLTAVVSDDFGNGGETTCTLEIASDLPEISITSPAEGAVFGDGGDCSTGTLGDHGVHVVATIDQVADREVDVLVNGVVVRADVTITAGPAGVGLIDVCVPVPDSETHMGSSVIRAQVASTQSGVVAFEERTVNIVLAGPTDGIVIDALLPGDEEDADFRDGVVATWAAPTEDWEGQLVAYELRCAATELEAVADDAAKDTWWDEADAVELPAALTPDDADPSATFSHRPGEPRHCVVRTRDVADNLGPIEESTDLTLVLRQTVVASGAGTQGYGFRVVAAGDVDGDGLDEVLVGGFGRAELVFGTSGDPAAASRVVFTTASTATVSVVGAGDFNGDGLDDFAIGSGVINSNFGKLSIFFGRPRAQWPSTAIDIETVCNADLCLEGASAIRAGRLTANVGDFDGDGLPDLALGSAPNNEIFVILGDDYEVRDCTACRASGESCDSNVCTRDIAPAAGTPAFWRLRYSLPTGDSVDPASGTDLEGFELTSSGGFGASLAGLGDFDTEPGNDLAIGAPTAHQVHFLSGREYSGTGIQTLATSDLGLPDPITGVPDGLPISDQNFTSYGFVIANIGDFYDVPSATSPKADLGIARSNVDELFVAPGDLTADTDAGFSASTVRITGSGNVGQSIATSFSPAHGLLGDLDGDGSPELCIGTRTATATNQHDILLWYPDQFADALSSGTVARPSAISIVTQTTDTGELAAQYVGDFNGDGHLDLAVGDYRANGSSGRLLLLY